MTMPIECPHCQEPINFKSLSYAFEPEDSCVYWTCVECNKSFDVYRDISYYTLEEKD